MFNSGQNHTTMASFSGRLVLCKWIHPGVITDSGWSEMLAILPSCMPTALHRQPTRLNYVGTKWIHCYLCLRCWLYLEHRICYIVTTYPSGFVCVSVVVSSLRILKTVYRPKDTFLQYRTRYMFFNSLQKDRFRGPVRKYIWNKYDFDIKLNCPRSRWSMNINSLF